MGYKIYLDEDASNCYSLEDFLLRGYQIGELDLEAHFIMKDAPVGHMERHLVSPLGASEEYEIFSLKIGADAYRHFDTYNQLLDHKALRGILS